MEVEVIVTALTTGLAAGISGTVTGALNDSYLALRRAILGLFTRQSGSGAADQVERLFDYDQYLKEPEKVRQQLTELLGSAHAGQDAAVVAAVERFQEKLESSPGLGQINIRGEKFIGTQFGVGHTMNLTYGTVPPSESSAEA